MPVKGASCAWPKLTLEYRESNYLWLGSIQAAVNYTCVDLWVHILHPAGTGERLLYGVLSEPTLIWGSEVHILNSWKEIANYLGRGVRTVQRWERDLGLPVHRPKGKDRSAVLAFPEELNAWLQQTPMRSATTFADPQPAERKVTAAVSTRDPNLVIQDVRQTSARAQKLLESLVQAAGRHQALAASLCETLNKITRRTARTTAV